MTKSEKFESAGKMFEDAHSKFYEYSQSIQQKLGGMDERRWNKYCEKVEQTFDMVKEQIGKANKKFHEEADKGNYKEAAKHMKKTLHGCLLMCKVAIIDTAESLGINRMLRKIGLLSKMPEQIMQNLHDQAKNIYPDIEATAKNLGKKAEKVAGKVEKGVGKAAEKFKKLAKRAANKASDLMR